MAPTMKRPQTMHGGTDFSADSIQHRSATKHIKYLLKQIDLEWHEFTLAVFHLSHKIKIPISRLVAV